jgi:hypothetical protein
MEMENSRFPTATTTNHQPPTTKQTSNFLANKAKAKLRVIGYYHKARG